MTVTRDFCDAEALQMGDFPRLEDTLKYPFSGHFGANPLDRRAERAATFLSDSEPYIARFSRRWFIAASSRDA
jgi:hypothetical protein